MKTAPNTLKSLLAPVGIGLLVPLTVVSYSGCKKDEPPPPLPSAAPVSTPDAPLALEIEDAGPDVVDADADAGKKLGPFKPAASLSACCAAIQQNAANAPEPTATYMKQAAATCYAAVKSGQGASQINAIARGVGVTCR